MEKAQKRSSDLQSELRTVSAALADREAAAEKARQDECQKHTVEAQSANTEMQKAHKRICNLRAELENLRSASADREAAAQKDEQDECQKLAAEAQSAIAATFL